MTGKRIEPKHVFGENLAVRPWRDEDTAATVRVWAFDDGKCWVSVDSHGVSMTVYGLTDDMRKLAAAIVAAADATDAGRAARDAPAAPVGCVGGAACPGCVVCQ